MDLNQTLVFLHILAAIVWMGAGLTLSLLSIYVRKNGEDLKFIRMMEWIGPRVGGPSVIIMITTGGWMVSRSAAWTFDQGWVTGALFLLVLLFIVGVAFHVPHYKKIYSAAEQYGAESVEVKQLAKMSFTAAKIETILLALAVWLMIVKPGI